MDPVKKKIRKINQVIFIFIIPALMFVYASFQDFSKVKESKVWQNYPQAEGILDYAKNNKYGSAFKIDVKYTYFIDGLEYKGDNLGHLDSGLLGNNATTKQEAINKYNLRKGNTVKVYYNPENHSESRLFAHTKKNRLSGIFSTIVSGVFWVIVLSLLVYRGKLKKSAGEASPAPKGLKT